MITFGENQFTISYRSKEARKKAREAYSSAYHTCVGATLIIAIVAIDMFRPTTRFILSCIFMALSTINFILGSGFYVRDKGSQTIFSRMSAAILAANKNWRIRLPERTDDGVNQHLSGNTLSVGPTI